MVNAYDITAAGAVDVTNDIITDVIDIGQCFSKALLVYKEFCDYESGTLNL